MIGIYTITDTVTGQRYVGQSVALVDRIGQHMRDLRCGKHINVAMQDSYDEYGRDVFRFRVVLQCRRNDLNFYEHLLVASFKSDVPKFGFNRTEAGDCTLRHTAATKAKIGEASKRQVPYVRTPEIRARIAASLAGRPSPKKGKPMSVEQRTKLADAKRQNWADPEYRAMMLARNHMPGCKRLSAETTAKIAAGVSRAHAEGRAIGPLTIQRRLETRIRNTNAGIGA